MSEPILTRHTGEQTVAMLDELTELYLEVRRDDPFHDDPLFSRSSFISRTKSQAGRAGFELITATVGNALAGFSFGYPIAAGSWWVDATPPPEHILKAPKFAVIELDVGRSYQRQGLGHALLDALLDERPEAYATLAAIPKSPPHAMYERWGWFMVGTIGGEGPVMDALVLPLAEKDR